MKIKLIKLHLSIRLNKYFGSIAIRKRYGKAYNKLQTLRKISSRRCLINLVNKYLNKLNNLLIEIELGVSEYSLNAKNNTQKI